MQTVRFPTPYRGKNKTLSDFDLILKCRKPLCPQQAMLREIYCPLHSPTVKKRCGLCEKHVRLVNSRYCASCDAAQDDMLFEPTRGYREEVICGALEDYMLELTGEVVGATDRPRPVVQGVEVVDWVAMKAHLGEGFADVRSDRWWQRFHIVILAECDENQHKSYDLDREVARDRTMREFGSRFVKGCPSMAPTAVVLLRVNPDEYMDSDGVKHRSCFQRVTFAADSRGHMQETYFEHFEEELFERMNIMQTTLQGILDQIETGELNGSVCHVVKLFFDGFNSSSHS